MKNDTYSKYSKDQMDAAVAAVNLALRQFRAGEPLTARCAFSGDALVVIVTPTSDPPCVWDVRCACGLSNSVFKGL